MRTLFQFGSATPPKGSCGKGLVRARELLEGSGTFKRRGLVGGSEVTGGMTWKGTLVA